MKKILIMTFLFMLFALPTKAEESHTIDEVREHNSEKDCWVVFEDQVYDITPNIKIHDKYMDIREWCGKDITNDFKTKDDFNRDHKPSTYAMLEDLSVGYLEYDQDINGTDHQEGEDDHEDEYFIEISGQEMKDLTIKEIAQLWQIDADQLLKKIISEFKLILDYSVDDKLDIFREEYKFSPAQVKNIAENMRDTSKENVIGNNETDNTSTLSNSNPYNIWLPTTLSLFLYLGTYYLIKTDWAKNNKLLKRATHNFTWNTAMLILLVFPTGGFGLYMVFTYTFPSLRMNFI